MFHEAVTFLYFVVDEIAVFVPAGLVVEVEPAELVRSVRGFKPLAFVGELVQPSDGQTRGHFVLVSDVGAVAEVVSQLQVVRRLRHENPLDLAVLAEVVLGSEQLRLDGELPFGRRFRG